MRASRPAPGPVVGIAIVVAFVLAAGGTLTALRAGDDESDRPGPSRSAEPEPERTDGAAPPSAEFPSDIPTVPAAQATAESGRGRGLSRVIPCYTLTARQLERVLDAPMNDVGQRAAGSSGFGLRGTEREDCYWFSTRADGPYVVLSTITTSQLRDRGEDLTARTYFDTIHDGPRTYLVGVGDAAYALGPASVAVLVGDVYLDVTVVTNEPRPLEKAAALARLLGRLRIHQP